MNLKVIHRIFFGFNDEEDIYLEYLQNWKEKLPDYEIKHWNMTNLPVDINPYTKAMVSLNDGVFLSDYFRWWVLREYGGIYLDGDIEIINGEALNKLVEELQDSKDYDAFIGVEMKNIGGYTSHSMVSKPNSSLSQFMCEIYENLGKLYLGRKEILIGPKITAYYFLDKGSFIEQKGYIFDFIEPIIKDRVKIYPKDYFSPISYGKTPVLEDLTSRSVLAHHYGNSWWEKDSYFFNQKLSMQKKRKKIADYLLEQKNFKYKLKQNLKKFFIEFCFPKGSKRRIWAKNIALKIIDKAIK